MSPCCNFRHPRQSFICCENSARHCVILAKLFVGDMVANDAVYHLRCLASLYRSAHSVRKETQEHEDTAQFGALQAFMEVQGYIKSLRELSKGSIIIYGMGGPHHPGGEEFWTRREGGAKNFGQAVKRCTNEATQGKMAEVV